MRTNRSSTIRLAAIILALMACGAAVPATAADSAPTLTEYTITSWSDTKLLSSGSTFTLAQGADGYLWLGTDAGLIRFDGATFSRWTGQATIPEARVMALCAAPDGSLWVGFALIGGLIRIREGEITTYTAADGLPSGYVHRLLAVRDGTIWAGGYRGLSRFRDGQWERVPLPPELASAPITALHQDANGVLWIGSQNGIYRRSPTADVFELFRQSYRVVDFSEDSTGAVWATHPSQGAIRLDDLSSGDTSPEGVGDMPPEGAAVGSGLQLLHDRSGNLWIATRSQGLVRMFGEGPTGTRQIERLGIRDGLASDSIRTLFEDGQGNIWVGSQAGLDRLSPATIATALETEEVDAVTTANDGSIWVSARAGVLQIADGALRRYQVVDGAQADTSPTAIHASDDGNVWLVTARGIARLVSGRFLHRPFPSGARLGFVGALAADHEGALWICDWVRGLFQFRDGLLKEVPTPPELGAPYSGFVDSSERVWIGFSSGGIAVFEAGTLHPRVVRNGGAVGDTIQTFYEDHQGTLWVGSNQGLSRIENGDWVDYSRHGLPAVPVTAVIEDDNANLWLGVGSGIIRIAAAELTEIRRNPSHRIAYTTYDSADGLKSRPTRNLQANAARAADGKLWFVTARGLAVVDPERAHHDHVVAPLVIESVLADSQRFDPTRRLSFPPLTSIVTISYTALEFRAPGMVRFRYKLEPLDREWVDAGTRQSASYARLPAGTYRFRVAMHHVGERQDESLAELDFSVEPMFYQTAWFGAATVAFLGVGLTGLWRLKLHAVRRRFAVVLAERVRVAREIHDTLLQGLVGIAIESKNVVALMDSSPEGAKELLERLGRHAEFYVRETRESIWNLRSPMLAAKDLSEEIRKIGKRLLENTAVRFNFTRLGDPRDVPVRLKEPLLRVSQEAILNAVQHGEAAEISVQLRYETASIFLLVQDDGRGFDETAERHAGWGLLNMRERAAEIGGQLTITSRPGSGTTIEMNLPLTPA